jgi:hypothetical protein
MILKMGLLTSLVGLCLEDHKSSESRLKHSRLVPRAFVRFGQHNETNTGTMFGWLR